MSKCICGRNHPFRACSDPAVLSRHISDLKKDNIRLLRACKSALDWLGECHAGTAQAEIADELRAAIAKAEGR